MVLKSSCFIVPLVLLFSWNFQVSESYTSQGNTVELAKEISVRNNGDETSSVEDKFRNVVIERWDELMKDQTASGTITYVHEKMKEMLNNHMSADSIVFISNAIREILQNVHTQTQILDLVHSMNEYLIEEQTPNELQKQLSESRKFLESKETPDWIKEKFTTMKEIVEMPKIDDIINEFGNMIVELVGSDNAEAEIKEMYKDLDGLMHTEMDEMLTNAVHNVGVNIKHKLSRVF